MFYRENSQLSTPRKFLWQKKWFERIRQTLSFIFPQRCLVCKKRDVAFCSSCRNKIPLETSPFLGKFLAVWQYDDPNLKRALWNLKYRGKKELAHNLAESLYDKLLEGLSESDQFSNSSEIRGQKYLLIPIPIHKNRIKSRGYNQAEILARELSFMNQDLFELETGVLWKEKETKSQVSLINREKRLKNVRGSFGIKNGEKIRGRDCLIIDDVTTTGATIHEAQKMLQRAGAKSVLGVTLAH